MAIFPNQDLTARGWGKCRPQIFPKFQHLLLSFLKPRCSTCDTYTAASAKEGVEEAEHTHAAPERSCLYPSPPHNHGLRNALFPKRHPKHSPTKSPCGPHHGFHVQAAFKRPVPSRESPKSRKRRSSSKAPAPLTPLSQGISALFLTPRTESGDILHLFLPVQGRLRGRGGDGCGDRPHHTALP